jgi:hypothetical protein
MVSNWFISSASKKPTVEAMTSFIHASTPVRGVDAALSASEVGLD